MIKIHINLEFIKKSNLDYEIINSDNVELMNIYKSSTQFYRLPINDISGTEIIPYQPLGNFTLYLLSNLEHFPNLNIDFDKTNLLQNYLLKCINNKKYCDTRIFLSFVRYILQMQSLKYQEYYASYHYSDEDLDNNIHHNNLEIKLDTFLQNVNKISIQKRYLCDSIIDLLVVSITEIFSNNYVIKKCRNCGKFFVSRHSNIFCPYISPQNENLSCLDYSQNTSYTQKRANDPVLSKYNTICNMLRKRAKYAELYQKDNQQQCELDYDNFRNEYLKVQKPKYLRGEITKNELLFFLKEKEIYLKNEYKTNRRKNGSTRNNKK